MSFRDGFQLFIYENDSQINLQYKCISHFVAKTHDSLQSRMEQHLCGKFHINKAATVLWMYRHWPLPLSETNGGQTVKVKGFRVYLTVNLRTFAQGVHICDTIQYMQFIVSCTHTRTSVHCKNRGQFRFSAKASMLISRFAHKATCCPLASVHA